ncbi:hypothetical protein FRC03_009077 [Tulasnella sp. 419]|nr:hypothetical protein FRC02_009931 [Tulasnella sp. 418]KAG8967942.1 hypothetical protein FRC03_009077 [Tulasnella sp. 419]
MAFTKSFVAAITALAFSSSFVSAAPVHKDLAARKAAPADWWSGWEDYQVYHARYNALGCKYQHNTVFFRDCCGPLYNGQALSARADICDPAKFPYTGTSTSTAAPSEATGTGGDEEDCSEEDDDIADEDVCDGECDDDDDDAPAPTSTKQASTKTTVEVPATSTPANDNNGGDNNNGGADVHSGGFATFYFQNGNPGACGDYNPDDALIAAIDHHRWGKDSFGEKSDLCGKKIHITNTKNNKSVTVILADVCPTCTNENSIDLSTGAFDKIATRDEGMVPIDWYFVE